MSNLQHFLFGGMPGYGGVNYGRSREHRPGGSWAGSSAPTVRVQRSRSNPPKSFAAPVPPPPRKTNQTHNNPLLELALHPIGSISLAARCHSSPSICEKVFIKLVADVPALITSHGFRLIEAFLSSEQKSLYARLVKSITVDWETLEKVLVTVQGRLVLYRLLKATGRFLAQKLVMLSRISWWISNPDAMPILILALELLEAHEVQILITDERLLDALANTSHGLYCVLKVMDRLVDEPAWHTRLSSLIQGKAATFTGAAALFDVIVYGEVMTEELIELLLLNLSSYTHSSSIECILQLIERGSEGIRETIVRVMSEGSPLPMIVRIRAGFHPVFWRIKRACDENMSGEQRKRLEDCLHGRVKAEKRESEEPTVSRHCVKRRCSENTEDTATKRVCPERPPNPTKTCYIAIPDAPPAPTRARSAPVRAAGTTVPPPPPPPPAPIQTIPILPSPVVASATKEPTRRQQAPSLESPTVATLDSVTPVETTVPPLSLTPLPTVSQTGSITAVTSTVDSVSIGAGEKVVKREEDEECVVVQKDDRAKDTAQNQKTPSIKIDPIDPGTDVMTLAMSGKASMIISKLSSGNAAFRSQIFACIQTGLMALILDERGVEVVKWFLTNGSADQKETVERTVASNLETMFECGQKGIVKEVMEKCEEKKRREEMERRIGELEKRLDERSVASGNREENEEDVEIVMESIKEKSQVDVTRPVAAVPVPAAPAAPTTSAVTDEIRKEYEHAKEISLQIYRGNLFVPPLHREIYFLFTKLDRWKTGYKDLFLCKQDADMLDDASRDLAAVEVLSQLSHCFFPVWAESSLYLITRIMRPLSSRIVFFPALASLLPRLASKDSSLQLQQLSGLLQFMLANETRPAFIFHVTDGDIKSPLFRMIMDENCDSNIVKAIVNLIFEKHLDRLDVFLSVHSSLMYCKGHARIMLMQLSIEHGRSKLPWLRVEIERLAATAAAAAHPVAAAANIQPSASSRS